VARPLLFLPGVKNPRQMLAAGFGGAVGSSFDIGTLILLKEWAHMSTPVAAFLAASVGAVVCFLLNKHVAFRDPRPVTVTEVARFGLVAVVTAFLMAFAMKVVADDLGVPYIVAKLLCAAGVFLAWTYPAQRKLVFRVRRPEPAPVAVPVVPLP
jgi:putative flippase GtrA